MNLLISGGAGYIGSHTAHQLVEAGHDVTVLDNLYSGFLWALPASATFVNGDIGDVNLLNTLFSQKRFDAVLHFAAHIEVAESVKNPTKYYLNNVSRALTLFTAAVSAHVPSILFSSTAAVYGNSESPIASETTDTHPINPYGMSKLMAERVLQDLTAASEGRTKFVILRYFNASGARRDLKLGQSTLRATHLIKVAAEAAVGIRPAVSIYGDDYPTPDGTCLRDYVYIEDLAQAHLDALQYMQGGGAPDIFNVGYGRLHSVKDVLQTMKRVTGVDFAVNIVGRRAGDPAVVGANAEKIRRVLGWKPCFDDLNLICRTTFEWEKKRLQEAAL